MAQNEIQNEIQNETQATSAAGGARNAWIVGPGYDLKFFIGCVILSPLCFFAFIGLVELFDWNVADSALAVYIAFLLLFDQPHIFQSLSRSHFDATEFRRNRVRHIVAPLIIVGLAPLYYYLGWEAVLLFAFTYYGMWHIFRQNVGLLGVYQARDNLGKFDRRFDWILYHAMFLGGFIVEILESRFVDEALMLNLGEGAMISEMRIRVAERIGDTGLMIFGAVFVVWLLRQAYLFLRSPEHGPRPSLPRYLFLAATGAVYAFLFIVLTEYFAVPLIVYVACDTIYHDVQYFGWVRRYNETVFPEKRRRFLRWMLGGYAYALIAVALYFLLPQYFAWGGVVSFALLMFVFYHYYLDGHIWRFSRDPELKPMLSQT